MLKVEIHQKGISYVMKLINFTEYDKQIPTELYPHFWLAIRLGSCFLAVVCIRGKKNANKFSSLWNKLSLHLRRQMHPMRGLCRRNELKNVIAVGKWIRFSEWLLCTFEMNAHPANFVACKMLQWMCATLLYFPLDATAVELIAWWILMCLKKFLITLHSFGSDGDGGGGAAAASTHKQQREKKRLLRFHFVAFGSRKCISLGHALPTTLSLSFAIRYWNTRHA